MLIPVVIIRPPDQIIPVETRPFRPDAPGISDKRSHLAYRWRADSLKNLFHCRRCDGYLTVISSYSQRFDLERASAARDAEELIFEQAHARWIVRSIGLVAGVARLGGRNSHGRAIAQA
ncbi:TPA: hypothetical protein UMZ03_000702 [Stenotrophomonas maltophilia]|jgi:hypothetical protein|nr:hypothetical protein [Stenotrophomonas maltophilia]HEL3237660.1 hypothetical protein [Stenotrophomonas maltophilia]HEL3850013.1 hypothetical protein [Stenotrophomonas maltophilia]HEL4187238.1 hypothetical protein [Stenotrophomonas maltophilia]